MDNTRPEFDTVIKDIADYLIQYNHYSDEAIKTARYTLLDSLACAFMSLAYPKCTQLLGPIVPGATLQNGAKIPGTNYQLEPVQAAFNLGAMIRWLDFNDTWLAAEWGHPSDNIGAILTLADYLNRSQQKKFTLQDIFHYMIKAHEIQGCLALKNSFNRVGLDHVFLVKIASTGVATHMLGGTHEQICNALSLAFVDGQSLRTYRHAPNTGSRKSWAAGDASSRGVRLALMAMQGAMGYPSALTAKIWGFYDVSFKGNAFQFERPYGSYVMENILFKISFPAEFHAQTAVECALQLHPKIKNKIDQIEKIEIDTQESAMRIINKTGPLYNPADRDHCLQYMTAIGLLFGELTAKHYEDDVAKNPAIDALREKMILKENKPFTTDYLDPDKRSIANAVQIFFKDGSSTKKITVEYPIGHRRRRAEGIPVLLTKFKHAVENHFNTKQAELILNQCQNITSLDKMSAPDFSDLFAKINN